MILRTNTSVILAVLALLTQFAGAEEPLPFSHPGRIRYDSHCLQIEGKDTLIYSGSFHYFRCQKELWRDRFQKIMYAGFNTVETYVPWNWHERQAPKSPDDFSKITGLQDLDDWITMAEKFGFYVIIRPGPYICSEWSGGGFPQWLVALKKPANWPAGKSWLQTDDPEFLAWSKHWYQAVCPVIAKHQITRKAPGQRGVIMFQIENEYERLNWLPHDMKKRHLEALATYAREGGIDVPLFTCWTSESRNVQAGPLKGVFDMMNYYPKWDIEKQLNKRTNQQRPQQPYAPAMSAELQGGWYSEVGGKLAEDLEGTAPVQTQNIALFELQLGYSLINYYMLFGGTNFDDWASRETTTTYDFAAAIREHGGVGEKYQRVSGIGRMLYEHGTQLARSDAVELETTVSDPAVEVAERRAPDGSRFIFVRTEDHSSPHNGAAQVQEKEGAAAFSFDFQLEPFGSMVLYLPPSATDAKSGEWLPKRGSEPQRPTDLPTPVVITNVERLSDPIPENWTPLAPGDILEKHVVFDRHFIYYRVAPPPGQPFAVGRIGDKVVNGTKADGVLALVDGKLLPEKYSDKDAVTFDMPDGAKEAILLFENRGLHQHTKSVLEENWLNGIKAVMAGGIAVPLEFTSSERERGLDFSDPKSDNMPGSVRVEIGKDAAAPEALLTWYRIKFALPDKKTGVWVPWHFHLEANGNGFIYVNGLCLGRYWQVGPQHDFYLPESWLNFGAGQTNFIVVSLRPVDKGVSVQAAFVAPDTAFAEAR